MWEFLKAEAAARGLLPGMTFDTTLLGTVPTAWCRTSGTVSVISRGLQRAANENGFVIEAADWRENRYTLRLMPSNALGNRRAAFGASVLTDGLEGKGRSDAD